MLWLARVKLASGLHLSQLRQDSSFAFWIELSEMTTIWTRR